MNPYNLIYILDDDELNNMLNKQFLAFSLPKTKVVTFQDPENLALNLVRNRLEHPDLLLLDISMPRISGWDFLDLLSKHQLTFDVMMLSSSMHFADIDKSREYSQVRNYITKPLTSSSIKHYIIDGKKSTIELD